MARIVIAGAGTVGCYIGGLLASAGHDVTLYGRSRVLNQIQTHGLTLTDTGGQSHWVSAQQIRLCEDPYSIDRGDIVLVCASSIDTSAIAREIAGNARPDAVVVALQNGLESTLVLQQALPHHDVRAGMVGFNIIAEGQGVYHRAVSGEIRIEAGGGDIAKALSVPGLKVGESDDIHGEQWGKLMLNLANGLNALAGQSLRDLLLDHDWRRVYADQIVEALKVLKAARIYPKLPLPIPVGLLPFALRMPTWIFKRAARNMVTIDPESKTSMARDLDAGRKTEIAAFQGAIVELGEGYGVPTPVSRRVMELVRAAELRKAGCPGLAPADLSGPVIPQGYAARISDGDVNAYSPSGG
jgi:2-dehydropantoate 2-reductase